MCRNLEGFTHHPLRQGAGIFWDLRVPRTRTTTMAMATTMAKETRLMLKTSRIYTSEVQNKRIIMGHQISSCHVLVVRSFFIL
jgi:hypothetical protein